MIDKLWFHMGSQVSADVTHGVDNPWKHNVRCQIFCQNQEEYDYLSSLNLMHGREIEIWLWAEWLDIRKGTIASGGRFLKVLPIAYTTWYTNLRGF